VSSMGEFRKLAHATEEELEIMRKLKVKLRVLSFLAEVAMKYNNEQQLLITQIELERYQLEYENELMQIYNRSGNFPSVGSVEVFKSGDVIEYFG